MKRLEALWIKVEMGGSNRKLNHIESAARASKEITKDHPHTQDRLLETVSDRQTVANPRRGVACLTLARCSPFHIFSCSNHLLFASPHVQPLFQKDKVGHETLPLSIGV